LEIKETLRFGLKCEGYFLLRLHLHFLKKKPPVTTVFSGHWSVVSVVLLVFLWHYYVVKLCLSIF